MAKNKRVQNIKDVLREKSKKLKEQAEINPRRLRVILTFAGPLLVTVIV